MTIFDKFKTKNIDELVEWFDEYCMTIDTPWTEYFDKTYCNNCEAEIIYEPYFNREFEYSWCELNDKCKYFPDIEDDIPDNKQILKMWLESEIEDD